MKKVYMSNGSAFSFDFGLKELVEHLQREFNLAKENLIVLGDDGEKVTPNNEQNFDTFYCFHSNDFSSPSDDNHNKDNHSNNNDNSLLFIKSIPRLTKLKVSESITLGVGASVDTKSILTTVLEKSYQYDHNLSNDLCDQAAEIYMELRKATEEIENKMICFQIAILNVSQPSSSMESLFSNMKHLNRSLLQSIADLPSTLSDLKARSISPELLSSSSSSSSPSSNMMIGGGSGGSGGLFNNNNNNINNNNKKKTLYEAAFEEEERVREFMEAGKISSSKINQLIEEKEKEVEEIKELTGKFQRSVEDLLKPEYERLVQIFNSINLLFIQIKEIQSKAEENNKEFRCRLPNISLEDLVMLQNQYTAKEGDLVSLLSRTNDLLTQFDSQRRSIHLTLSSQYSSLSHLHSLSSSLSSHSPLYQSISDKQIQYLIQVKCICLIPHTYQLCLSEIHRRSSFKRSFIKAMSLLNHRLNDVIRKEGERRESFLDDHRDSILFSLFPSFLLPLPSFSFDLSLFDPLLPSLPSIHNNDNGNDSYNNNNSYNIVEIEEEEDEGVERALFSSSLSPSSSSSSLSKRREEEMKEEMEKMKEEMEKMKEEMKREMEEMKEEKEREMKMKMEMEKKRMEKEKEEMMKRMKEQGERMEELEKQLERSEQSRSDLADRLSLSSRSLDQLQVKCDQMDQEMKVKMKEWAGVEEEKEEKKREIASLTSRLADLSSELSSLSSLRSKEKREWEEERMGMEQGIERGRSEIASLSSLMLSLRSDLSSLSQQKAQLEQGMKEEKASLSSSIISIAEEKISLERRIAEEKVSLERRMAEDRKNMADQISSLISEKRSMREQVDSLLLSIHSLQSDLASISSDKAELSSTNGAMGLEIAQCKDQIHQLNDRIAHLLDDLSLSNSQLINKESEIRALKNDLSIKLGEGNAMKNDLAGKLNEISSLKSDLSSSLSSLSSLQSENEQMKGEMITLRKTNDSLKSDLSSLHLDHSRKQTEIHSLHNKIHQLNEALKKFEQQNSQLNASLYGAPNQEAAIQSLRSENDQLIEAMAKKDHQMIALTQSVAELKKEYANKMKALNEKVEMYRHCAEEVKKEAKEYKQRAEDIEKENLHLQVKLMTYEDEHPPPSPSPLLPSPPAADPLSHPLFIEQSAKLSAYLAHEKKLLSIVGQFDKSIARRGNETPFQLVESTLLWLADYHRQSEIQSDSLSAETKKLQSRLADFDFPISLKSSFGVPSPNNGIFSMIHSVMDWLDDFYLTSKLKKTIALNNFTVGDNVILFERKDKHLEVFSLNCPNYILSEDCGGIFTVGNNNMNSARPQELMFATILSIEEKITTPSDDPYRMGPRIKYFVIFAEKFFPS